FRASFEASSRRISATSGSPSCSAMRMHSRSFFASRAVPSYSRTIWRSSRPSFASHRASTTEWGIPQPRRSHSSERRFNSRASAFVRVNGLRTVAPACGVIHLQPPFEDNSKDSHDPTLLHRVQNAMVSNSQFPGSFWHAVDASTQAPSISRLVLRLIPELPDGLQDRSGIERPEVVELPFRLWLPLQRIGARHLVHSPTVVGDGRAWLRRYSARMTTPAQTRAAAIRMARAGRSRRTVQA